MIKKFCLYFSIFFIAILAILNSRFVSAELKFWLNPPKPLAITTSPAPSLTPSPTANQEKPVQNNTVQNKPVVSDSYVIAIPSLGVRAPIILEKSQDPNIIFNRLEEGVVHSSNSPLPGETGTSIILGHSSAYPWYKGSYGSVFALIGKLNPGDKIIIENGSRLLIYQVETSLIFHPLSRNKSIEDISRSSGSSILLVSCWPVGTNLKRIAVKANLVD